MRTPAHKESVQGEQAVHWVEALGAWAVAGYAEAQRSLVDPHLSTVRDPELATRAAPETGEVPTASEFFGSWFSRSAAHSRIKRSLYRPYSERCMSGLEAMFRTVAAECAAALPSHGDLMVDFLTPFAMRSTARMMDIPETELSRLTRVVTVLNRFLNGVPFTDRNLRSVEQCIRYLHALVEQLFQVSAPGETVRALRRIAAESESGQWAAVSTLGQLLTAGFEPMTTGAGLASKEIHARPELLAKLRAGAVDVGDVAEEALRLNPPFPYIHRWAVQRCDCLGPALAPGTYVVIDLRSANRDPEVFDEPARFRPERDRGDNLTYGRGPHYCLGIGMARLQIAVALQALLDIRPEVRVHTADTRIEDIGYFVEVSSLPFDRAGG